jgi:hypothetical protein
MLCQNATRSLTVGSIGSVACDLFLTHPPLTTPCRDDADMLAPAAPADVDEHEALPQEVEARYARNLRNHTVHAAAFLRQA